MHVRKWIERVSYATLSLSVWLTASSAWAAGAGGGALPWDTPLQTITTDMTGPRLPVKQRLGARSCR
jgi:type IV secretory pathway VirB2 component (pilin)